MTSSENRLLGALPPHDYARLVARMTDVTFEHRGSAYRSGGPLDAVYFPRSGVMSSVMIMLDGSTAEVAATGAEGMLGYSTLLGATRSVEEVFCQIPPCVCRRLPAAEFVAEVARGGPLTAVVHSYTRSVLATSAQLIACNALHAVNERCARWLLMCRDRVGADDFPLTQEFLATMLGVRRATVTVAAGTLQGAGLITYRHGRLKILDAPGLEAASCECYAAMRGSFDTPS